jgi:hypothetical protein
MLSPVKVPGVARVPVCSMPAAANASGPSRAPLPITCTAIDRDGPHRSGGFDDAIVGRYGDVRIVQDERPVPS